MSCSYLASIPINAECVTLTVEMQEGISEIKNGLADLKEAVASLAKEQAELVSVLSMIKDNITDLKDCRENLKTEILNKTADPGSEDKGKSLLLCSYFQTVY